jgi:excisionase family DNA binding protein
MACKSTTFAFHAPRVTATVPQIRSQIGVLAHSALSLELAKHGEIRWPRRATGGLKSCGIHPYDREARTISRGLCGLPPAPGRRPRVLVRHWTARALWQTAHYGEPAMRTGSNSELDRGLTTAEAATALGVHVRTLRRYISLGLLAHRRLPGGHYRIPESAIREFWRANESAQPGRRRAAAGSPSYDMAQSEPRTRSRSPRRRRLGADTASSYDLSTAGLSELRSRFS